MQASTNILFSIYLALAYITILASSCNKALEPAELIRWVEDEKNGFRQNLTSGDLNFTLQECPPAYRTCIENRGNITSEDILSINSEEPLLHFHLILKPDKSETPFLAYQAEDEAEYFDRLKYFVSKVERDIFLISNSDTIFPILCHFERNYHVAPYNTLVFAFENAEHIGETFRIIYNDRIFNQGPVSFNIIKNKRIPKLKSGKSKL